MFVDDVLFKFCGCNFAGREVSSSAESVPSRAYMAGRTWERSCTWEGMYMASLDSPYMRGNVLEGTYPIYHVHGRILFFSLVFTIN